MTGSDWAANDVPAPFYSYFFDHETPYALPGAHSWTLDVYGDGLSNMPYPQHILRDPRRARDNFLQWYDRTGSPTDPADESDPRFDYLAQMTLHEYLTQQEHFHPAVSDFYSRFAVDALAATSQQVNAYTAIAFLGAEYHPIFTFPGGTSGIARHLLHWLIPAAIDGSTTAQLMANPIRIDQLDRPDHHVRVRQGAMVLRTDTSPQMASVDYFRDGHFYRAAAKAVSNVSSRRESSTRGQVRCRLNVCQVGDFRCRMRPGIRTGLRCQARSTKEDNGDPL